MALEACFDDAVQFGTLLPETSHDDVVAFVHRIGIGTDIAQVSLDSTVLSARTTNSLKRAGLSIIADLARFEDEFDLQQSVRGLGVASLQELRDLIRRCVRGEAVQQLPVEHESGVAVVPESVCECLREHGLDPRRISMEALDLSPRVANGLARAGVRTLSQLCQVTDVELMANVRNFGRVGLDELLSAIHGLVSTERMQRILLLDGPPSDTNTIMLRWASSNDTSRLHGHQAVVPSQLGDSEIESSMLRLSERRGILPSQEALVLSSMLDDLRRFAAWAAAEHDQGTLGDAFVLAARLTELPTEIESVWQSLTSPYVGLVAGSGWRAVAPSDTRLCDSPLVEPDVLRDLRRRLINPYLISLQALPLPLRVQNALRHAHFRVLGQLEGLNESLFTKRVRGIGVLGIQQLREATEALSCNKISPPSSAVLTLTDGAALESLNALVAWMMDRSGSGSIIDAIGGFDPGEDLPPDISRARETLLTIATCELGRSYLDRYDWRTTATRVLSRLTATEVAILRLREFALHGKLRLAELGDAHNLSRERIRQIEARALQRLAGALEADDNQSLVRAARRLCSKLGSACPLATMIECLHEKPNESVDTQHLSDEALLILWHAGPYEVLDDWLVTAPARHLLDRSWSRLKGLLANGPVSLEDARMALGNVGILESHCDAWLNRCDEVRVVDDYVCDWTGALGDKAAAILQIRGAPMTRDELSVVICGDHAESSLQNSLHTDERLMRTGPEHFGLRAWGGDEYTNIVEAIRVEIERRGGEIAIETLTATLVERFGVADTSVRNYAGGVKFVRTGRGTVRLADAPPRTGGLRSIEMTKHCFRLRDGWAWRVPVTYDTLRGSGRPMPVGVAQHLGLNRGGVVIRRGPVGEVRFSWPMNQAQPIVGSLRLAAEALHATEGDYIFVEIVGESELRFHLVRRADRERLTGDERLACEVNGRLEDWDANPVRMVAFALGLDDRDGDLLLTVRSRLRARDDEGIFDLMPSSRGSVDERSLTDLVDLVTWSSWD